MHSRKRPVTFMLMMYIRREFPTWQARNSSALRGVITRPGDDQALSREHADCNPGTSCLGLDARLLHELPHQEQPPITVAPTQANPETPAHRPLLTIATPDLPTPLMTEEELQHTIGPFQGSCTASPEGLPTHQGPPMLQQDAPAEVGGGVYQGSTTVSPAGCWGAPTRCSQPHPAAAGACRTVWGGVPHPAPIRGGPHRILHIHAGMAPAIGPTHTPHLQATELRSGCLRARRSESLTGPAPQQSSTRDGDGC